MLRKVSDLFFQCQFSWSKLKLWTCLGWHSAVARLIYSKLNEKIEKMSELLFLVAVKITAPTAVLPALIIFANDYFTDNLSDESFYLPYPVM